MLNLLIVLPQTGMMGGGWFLSPKHHGALSFVFFPGKYYTVALALLSAAKCSMFYVRTLSEGTG